MTVAAVVLITVCLVHAPILRGLAGFLIVDQPTDDYGCVCISSWGDRPNGDRCYDVAAGLFHQKPSCRVLLVAPGPDRLEEIGAMTSFTAMSRRELLARGVPQEAVSVLRGERWNDWATARALADWMRDHPGNSVLLLCDQFHSAQLRRVLDAVLDPAEAASVRVRALRSRMCDNTNWWTQRSGYRAFAGSWLLQLQRRFGGGDAAQTAERNAADYERDFLQAFQENTP